MALLAQDLREAVLQAAFEGKLTDSFSKDSVVSSFVEKYKSNVYPFKVKETWKWECLGNVVNIRSAIRVHQSDWRTSGIPFFRAREIVELSKNGSIDNELYIDDELYNKCALNSGVPKPGDLMVSGVGTLGASYVVKDNDKFYYKDASVLCFENIYNQNSKFLYYLMKTPYMHNQIYDESAFGTTVATLTMKRANVFMCAIPPIEEQQRIVERVEGLMSKIDEFEKIENKLEALKKSFPEDMKAALLQAAMQGKLTEQSERDSNILDFNNKKLEEADFAIPSNWKFGHLESVTNTISSKQYQIPDSQINKEGKYPVVSQSKDYIVGYTNNSEKLFVHNNPVVVFGDHTTIIKHIDFDFVVGADGTKIFEPISEIVDSQYLAFVLTYYCIGLNKIGGYSRHYKFIKNKPIPIPPIDEQQRIVEKLDKLISLCDSCFSM